MARNPEQNQKMRDARRKKILSIAVRLFAVRGLQATKISDIAGAAGMSQGLLYHYFKSKEEIFVEIVRMAFENMNAAARALETSSMSPRDKLEVMVTKVVDSVRDSDDFVWFSTLISAASISDAVPEEAKEIIQRERAVPYRVVARIVRAGQEDGTVKSQDADELATAFWTAIKGLALHKAALGNEFRAPSPAVLSSFFF